MSASPSVPADAPAWRGRWRDTRTRYEASRIGLLQRRVVDVRLTQQALILAALAFMLVVPALITLAAFLPLGRPGGALSGFAQRAGLTPEATRDLQQLFPTTTTVSGATTGVGLLLTVILTVRWPLALQRGYELVWGLPPRGVTALWRPLAWVVGFLALAAAAVLVGPVLDAGMRVLVILVAGTPLAVAWAWWTQHLLLAGRIGWSRLLPGALLTGLGLVGLRLAAAVLLSPQITSHHRQYGPLGVVFVILSWFVAFGVVMLGGAVVGHFLAEGRRPAVASPRGDEAPAPGPDESPDEPGAPARGTGGG
ncbi:YhjD/YihY/BrkB family envelope integrity protein [Actinomycetospora cinnamomea]|uniref:Membrane protein n=1 Tax=Actinomycetospora cinnamomea TaxID=663609 RepID=A0A2U1EZP9_9PSEU|nr:YhjD/YihY/BrkB family envelope integrity protein [Actinomycetospora cinnamomea]PVZ05396.1 membrane protein [Actinomycetospora cinnamomea]